MFRKWHGNYSILAWRIVPLILRSMLHSRFATRLTMFKMRGSRITSRGGRAGIPSEGRKGRGRCQHAQTITACSLLWVLLKKVEREPHVKTPCFIVCLEISINKNTHLPSSLSLFSLSYSLTHTHKCHIFYWCETVNCTFLPTFLL